MRIWDLDPAVLCRAHLLGEHRELHATWNVITLNKRGYAQHPEVARWHGRLAALFARHEALVAELAARGYRHLSPLNPELAVGKRRQTVLIDPISEQLARLTAKPCPCPRPDRAGGG